MSGWAKDAHAEHLQGISTTRYGQNYPQHYPQAREWKSPNALWNHREGSLLPRTRTKGQPHGRKIT